MRLLTPLAVTLALACGAEAQEGYAQLLDRGRSLESRGALEEALDAYDRAIAASAEDWRAYLLRGQVRFRLGRVADSVADFDTVVDLAPDQEPYLWQRGISQYYVAAFEPCRRQFEIHRNVNPDDVENAVWHFLCVARAEGFAAARAAILPVGPDPRPPMTTVYDLFRGKARVADVLAAAGIVEGGPPSSFDAGGAFYGHLYVALYLEAIGEVDAARGHLEAATRIDFPHYMGDVARVHLRRLDGP